MKKSTSQSRRALLRGSIKGLAAAVAAAAVPWSRAGAADDLPRVSEDDETAKALQYVHDASDAGEGRGDDEYCHNCRYFKGTQDTSWERCDLFPGKTVAAQGWCNTWAAKG